MPTRSNPFAPDHDRHDVIQLQGYHSGRATCRPPENPGPILTPLKVAGPALATRIEQPYTPSVERITRHYLGTFEAIARTAAESGGTLTAQAASVSPAAPPHGAPALCAITPPGTPA